MSWYIVRCPDGNQLGYPYCDKVIFNFLNGRSQLHDVFNNINLKLIKLYLYTI